MRAGVFLIALSVAPTALADFTGRVVKVSDGDTLTVLVSKTQIRVRLDSIDAPERAQAFGKRSQQSLAVSTPKRSAQTPDVPSVAESGVPGYDYVAEIGMLAPAGTAPAIVSRLAAEVQKAVKQPDVAQRFRQLGIDPAGSTPDAYNALNRENDRKYEKLVKASGAKID